MSKLRVHTMLVSLQGPGAGPHEHLRGPSGGGVTNDEQVFTTRTFQRLVGREVGATGGDDDFTWRSSTNLGAWIIGRNMFGPIRGPWPDATSQGSWGDEPPFHAPVFVLTHYPRPSLALSGGTTFHFVTEGFHAALARARAAAGGRDVRLGGGVQTIRSYLKAGLVDELHLAIAPMLLGAGEPLLADLDLSGLGYVRTEFRPSAHAAYVVFGRCARSQADSKGSFGGTS